MNEGLALRLLEQVMGWDDATALRETTWLRLMSQYKYDNYHDYLAGARFMGRLADWLQQFERKDRSAAYAYVRQHLVFVSLPEMRHLVDRFYPETIAKLLTQAVGHKIDIPSYLVWNHSEAEKVFAEVSRKTLYLGLSDGARIDSFRRCNEGRISNEQVIVATQIHPDKWNEVLKKLCAFCETDTAKFQRVVLIDDFVGSGKTLLRWEEEDKKWDGKLVKFYNESKERFATHFEENWSLHIHHYVASYKGHRAVQETERARAEASPEDWFRKVEFTFGWVLPEMLPIQEERDAAFWDLTDRYYDCAVESKSTALGGDHVRRGFGDGGLPLILEHNTPNNSVALLWAETTGTTGQHPMRPLFRRAQRHW
jgi:hypothetical protein